MDVLAQRFEDSRPHLAAVAYRMLGSRSEADDAVQEAWLRLARSDVDGVDNLRGWLTTVVARVCLDMLRSRTSRREEPLTTDERVAPEPGPEGEALLADSVGAALLVVLDTLAPAERLAFVLHDLFAVPFDEIGAIVGRSPAAARQLASRARRRVQGVGTETDAEADPSPLAEPPRPGVDEAAVGGLHPTAGGPDGAAGQAAARGGGPAAESRTGQAVAGDRSPAVAGRAGARGGGASATQGTDVGAGAHDALAVGEGARAAAIEAARGRGAEFPRDDAGSARRREVVAAFLAASRGGDFAALLALLDPDAVARADAAAVVAGAEAEVRGATAVAGTFAGRAKAARLALLDGEPGLIWTYRGEVRMAFAFTVLDGRVTDVELIADPARLAGMGVEPLP